jgi:hypothetical protein
MNGTFSIEILNLLSPNLRLRLEPWILASILTCLPPNHLNYRTRPLLFFPPESMRPC